MQATALLTHALIAATTSQDANYCVLPDNQAIKDTMSKCLIALEPISLQSSCFNIYSTESKACNTYYTQAGIICNQ
eukprot:scaffold50248_cov38-Prasinocladus_malaysianus.AAC.1